MTSNNTMQPTILSVTSFACAKAAPLRIAADRERYAPNSAVGLRLDTIEVAVMPVLLGRAVPLLPGSKNQTELALGAQWSLR